VMDILTSAMTITVGFSPMAMVVPASDVITWLSLSLYRKIYKFIDIELAFFGIILECLFI
jgi:hypothetical protein